MPSPEAKQKYNRDWYIAHRKESYIRKRKWEKQHPRRMFDLMLRRVYNISIDAYEAMVEMQHGVCAVCGKLPRGKGPSGKRLHVDHNHLTEALRGLLCAQCNMALGLLQENKTNIRALLTYLEAYEPDYS